MATTSMPTASRDWSNARLACAAMVRYVLEREGDVAAVIAEPARAVPFIPPPGYWQVRARGLPCATVPC